MVPYVYNSSAPAMQSLVIDRFFGRFGASRVDHTICAATHGMAWDEMFGGMLSADPRDVVHARLVVVWGANPTISNVHFPPLVNEARKRGRAPDRRRSAAHRDGAARRSPSRAAAGNRCRARAGDGRAPRPRRSRRPRVPRAAHRRARTSSSLPRDRGLPKRAETVCGVAAADIVDTAEELAADAAGLLPRRVGSRAQPQRRLGVRRRVRACRCSPGSSGCSGSGIFASLSDAAPLTIGPRDPAERHTAARPRTST